MPTVVFNKDATIGGFKFEIPAPITADQAGPVLQPQLPLAYAATDWTKNTGVAVLAEGHGITTGMVVDLYWSGGYRYGMVATVSGNNVTLADGAGAGGTATPADDTAVILAQQAAVTFSFVASALAGIMATATSRSLLILTDSIAGTYVYELDPGSATTTAKGLQWSNADAGTSPWVGKTIVSATASSSNTTAPTSPAINQPVAIGIMYDCTTGSGS